jgi:hypothetical protein
MAASYPVSIKSFGIPHADFTEYVVAAHPNDIQAEIVAMQTNFGTNPHIGQDVNGNAGVVYATLKARIDDIMAGVRAHTHSSADGVKLAQANTHQSADTDTGPTSIHHTLGVTANQAATGTHTHSLATVPGRNAIRNGDMGVAQRPGTFTTTGARTIDGSQMFFSGGTMTVLREIENPGGGIGMMKFTHRSAVTGQAAASDFAYNTWHIESVWTYAGRQVTLSFRGATFGPSQKVGIEIEQFFGTGGSPSTTVQTAISSVTIPSSAAAGYSVTFTVPAITGKVLGSNDDDYLGINLWVSAGTTYATRSSTTGIQNGNTLITDLQLEDGGIATPFDRLSPQAQLAWCQRYYYRVNGLIAQAIAIGQASLPSAAWFRVQHPVPMRAAPVQDWMAPSNYKLSSAAMGNITFTNMNTGTDIYCDFFQAYGASGLVAGNATFLYFTVNGYYGYSAEL